MKNKIKFKDCTKDSSELINNPQIGHLLSDETIYTDFDDFDYNVFRDKFLNTLEIDRYDFHKMFPHIKQIESFKELFDDMTPDEIDVIYGKYADPDCKTETINCMMLEFDFDTSPEYAQVINLNEYSFDLIKYYLSKYSWRFDEVGFFEYENSTYIYLLCDEEN